MELINSLGKLSILAYFIFIVALCLGYIYKAKFRRSKFVEYFGNVSPDDDTDKKKTSHSVSVSH